MTSTHNPLGLTSRWPSLCSFKSSGKDFHGFRSVFMGMFDYPSRSTFVRSDTRGFGLQCLLSFIPKCVLSSLSQSSSSTTKFCSCLDGLNVAAWPSWTWSCSQKVKHLKNTLSALYNVISKESSSEIQTHSSDWEMKPDLFPQCSIKSNGRRICTTASNILHSIHEVLHYSWAIAHSHFWIKAFINVIYAAVFILFDLR